MRKEEIRTLRILMIEIGLLILFLIANLIIVSTKLYFVLHQSMGCGT